MLQTFLIMGETKRRESTGHDMILKKVAFNGDFFLDLIYANSNSQFPIPNSQFPIPNSQILEHLY